MKIRHTTTAMLLTVLSHSVSYAPRVLLALKLERDNTRTTASSFRGTDTLDQLRQLRQYQTRHINDMIRKVLDDYTVQIIIERIKWCSAKMFKQEKYNKSE